MARPIAGINESPYGVCGYIVDGAFLRDGTKIKTVRIYKQRSDVMFDLIDPSTMAIYQKMLITGVDTSGVLLDYSLSNDVLVNSIPKNTFFIRGYNELRSREGFVVRFLLNKVILSSGLPLYDMYTPTCAIPLPDIGNVIINAVLVNDTTITGTILSSTGSLDVTDMIVTITVDGIEYSTTVNIDGTFELTGVVITTSGTATYTVTSPNYNEKIGSFPILASGEDSDLITAIDVFSNQFTQNPDGSYSAVIPGSVHMRSNKIVVQVLDPVNSNAVQFSTVNVAGNGDITITQTAPEQVEVIIMGSTLLTVPYSASIVWDDNGNGTFSSTIPYSTYDKDNAMFSIYDGSSIVSTDVQINDGGDITLTSLNDFIGDIVIVGR